MKHIQTISILLGVLLTGCAWTTVTPITATNRNAEGWRVYAPKTLLVVSGSSVTPVVVADCSKEYAVKYGTFFAKKDVEIDVTNGVISKVDDQEDTTAIPADILSAATEAAKAGTTFNSTAPPATGTTFGIFSVDCETSADGNETPTLTPVIYKGHNPLLMLPGQPAGSGGGTPALPKGAAPVPTASDSHPTGSGERETPSGTDSGTAQQTGTHTTSHSLR